MLRGAEVETDYGHILLYGVNADMTRRFDFANVRLPAQEVISEVARMGGVAAPCHPGRPTIGLCEHYATRPPLAGVVAVEALNGGSRRGENERVQALIDAHGYGAFGGSDAHLVSLIGIPPLAGFVGKFAIFAALMDGYQITGRTYLLVLISWVFFRADSVSSALDILTKIVTAPGLLFIPPGPDVVAPLYAIGGISLLVAIELKREYSRGAWTFFGHRNEYIRVLAYGLIVAVIISMGVFDGGQFIYAQF